MPRLSSERTAEYRGIEKTVRPTEDQIDEEVATLSFGERFKLLISQMYSTATDKSMKWDIWQFIFTIALLVIGLIMMYSASYAYAHYYQKGDSTYYIRRQAIFAAIGLVAMYVASLLPMWFLKRSVPWVIGIATALLVIVYFVPTNSEHRWIRLGSLSFQPSEIGKLAVILFIACYAAKNAHRIQSFKFGVAFYLPVIGVIAMLIAGETHLSCFILICLISATMMFVGGTPKKWLIAIGILALAGAAILVFFTSYMKTRVEVWIDPFSDALGAGWQNIQAHYAIASGGLLGQGIGNSRQKYLYISEPQNDFIFAVVCEELGFVGAVFIMTLFALFVWRGLTVSMANTDRFARLLGVGVTAQIGWQAILNIGVVTRALPNTGISLPFFSYGGTALVLLLFSAGLLLGVSRGSSKKII